jgi:hypothetical protein
MVNRNASLGFIIRGATGNFITAGYELQEGVTDPFVSELLACRLGLEEAKRQGCTRVEVQVDCQQILNLWKDDRRLKCAGVHILEELKTLGGSFLDFKISFVRREANWAAHLCAKHVITSKVSALFAEVPGFLGWSCPVRYKLYS